MKIDDLFVVIEPEEMHLLGSWPDFFYMAVRWKDSINTGLQFNGITVETIIKDTEGKYSYFDTESVCWQPWNINLNTIHEQNEFTVQYYLVPKEK